MNSIKKKSIIFMVLFFILVLTSFIIFLSYKKLNDKDFSKNPVGNVSKHPKRVYNCGSIDCGKKVSPTEF